MAKAHIHAESSAKRWGGNPDDYMPLHSLLDSSKSVIADSRHRSLTHHAWFISVIIPRIFGDTAVNSDGKTYSPKDVAEQHVAEDYRGFIPSAQDFLENMALEPWMNNGAGQAKPPSLRKAFPAKPSRFDIQD